MDRLPSDETSQQRGLPPVEASVQSPVVGLHSGNKRAFARDRQIPHTPCKREPLDHSAPITQHRPNLQRPEASIPVSPREVTGRAIVFEPNDAILPSQSPPGRSEIVDLTVSPTPELSEEHYSSRDNGQQEDAENHPALSQAAESHEQQGCLPREIVKEVLRLAYSEEMVQGHVKTGNMINLACIWCHKDGRFPDGRLAKAHNLYIFNDGARKQPVLSACDNINEAIKSRKELAASLDSTFIKGNNFNAVHVNLKDSGACLFVPQESELKEEIFKELEIAQSQRTWSGKEKTLSLAGKGRTVNVALRESLFSANMFKETLGWFDKSRDQATTRDPRESHDALSQAAAPHHATNGMPSLDNAENNATESLVNRHDVADMEDGEILPHVQQNHSAGAAPPMPQAKRQKATSSHDQSSAGTGQNIANLPTEQVGEGLDASLSMQVEHAQEIQNNTSGTAFTDEALGQDEHDREISFNVGMQAQQEYSTPQIAYRAVVQPGQNRVLGEQPNARTERSIENPPAEQVEEEHTQAAEPGEPYQQIHNDMNGVSATSDDHAESENVVQSEYEFQLPTDPRLKMKIGQAGENHVVGQQNSDGLVPMPDLKRKVHVLTGRIQGLQGESERLKRDLWNLKAECTKVRTKCNEAEKSAAHFRDLNKSLSKKNVELQEEIQRKSRKIQDLGDETIRIRIQNDDIGGRLREQRESNRSAQNLLDEFRKMLNNHRESDNVYPPRNRRSNNNRGRNH